MISGVFSHILEQFSVKAALKKILFDKTDALISPFLVNSADFPLTASSLETLIAYRSAIALKLAMAEPVASRNIADRLVQLIIEPVRHEEVQVCSAPSLALTISDHWMVKADTQGWIILTLSELGITIWLQGLNAITTLCCQDKSEPVNDFPPDLLRYWPLSPHLRLSLPMVLQHEHARCCTWLRRSHLQDGELTTTLVPYHSTPLASQPHWRWSDQSPIACYQLLRTIVHTLDIMAERKGDPMTCLRQGYALGQAVYTFEASIPLGTVQMLPSEVQLAIWSVMQAAQQVLGLIISNVLQQKPVENF